MDKETILQEVCQYYQEHHGQSSYRPGERISYAGRVYDQDELCNLVDSALEFWLTAGRYTREFEEGFAEYMGVPYCSLVNSGSSANLLAISALTSPLLGERSLRRGDEVITVAAGFPTTVAPILQSGLVPVFVDVCLQNGNINSLLLEQAVSSKTKAVILAHTLGNPFAVKIILEFCQKYDLWLIEDNCDALGGEVVLNEHSQKLGTIGDIGTSSFYPAHHITMGEGGAVYTKNPLLHKIVRSLRDWGRDCVCTGGEDNHCGYRFNGKFGALPKGYDHKYVYSHLGYNLKATDLQAAIGVAQLKKLPGFVNKRRENWEYLRARLEPLQKWLLLPEQRPDTNPSWFGFLLTVREESPVTRDEIVAHLESHNIQTRPLFAGNLTRHPCFEHLENGRDYRVVGSLSVTDYIMGHSFWLGVYPGLSVEMLDEIVRKLFDCFL